MQRNPRCIIYYNNFINVDMYKIYSNNNILSGFQQQFIHGFNHAPPCKISWMFFKNVSNLKQSEKDY